MAPVDAAEDYRRNAQRYLIDAIRTSNFVAKAMMLDLAEHWLRRAERDDGIQQTQPEKEPEGEPS
jgi:hypothetical protein